MMEPRITGIFFEVDGDAFNLGAELEDIALCHGEIVSFEDSPPVSADDALADSFYSAYARYEAERAEK